MILFCMNFSQWYLMCQIRKKNKEIKTQQEKNVGNISDTKQTENVKIYSNRGKVEGKLSYLYCPGAYKDILF